MMRRRLSLISVLLALVSTPPIRAELRPPAEQGGYVGLGLMLRKLTTVGTFMQTTAHPDDENNTLLAMLSFGKGFRTVVATATRGNGGQNEIGPELFEALGVLRTEELLAAHRVDGAEQYFTRAIDFGYSFSTEETFERWGRQEILADYVRLIRLIRPDVVAALRPDGAGGGQHHQASALITREAIGAAADPAQFPEQIQEGLRPWQAKKLYALAAFGFRGEPPPPEGVRLVPVDGNVYDPLLGRTYAELGSEARAMHKCQGFGQLLALPGPATARYRLVETAVSGQMEKDETTLFDGVDTSIASLAQYIDGRAPQAVVLGLSAIARHAEAALKQFESEGIDAAIPAILSGLAAVRNLRAQLPASGLSPDTVFEIDHRLKLKEVQFSEAAVLAHGLRVDALADDGIVVSGQTVKVAVIVANRGRRDVGVSGVALAGLEGSAACEPGAVASGGVFRCESSSLRVPAGARSSEPYWEPLPDAARYHVAPDAPFGLPFRPTPFRARIGLRVPAGEVSLELPIEYRYEGSIFSGEKRMELKVVPAFSVTVTPEIAIIPSSLVRGSRPSVPMAGHGARGHAAGRGGDPAEREVRVTVVNGAQGAARGEVALELPAGWRATPGSAPVEFARQDEARTVRFQVGPAAGTKTGEYRIRAIVSAGGERFDRGYQVVEYPHIERRHLYHPAETAIKVIDVRMTPGLTIGYVMGVGDQVPPAIVQLGARVALIDADQLSWGDLSRYDAIVTGVRAYERRDDLRAHNRRLIEYVERGGTLIVQYNKFEFNDAQYGPYPAKVSANRVTDEHSPVEILTPAHPVFNVPNTIGESAWKGWVQERGLYFLGERDARYTDLVQLEDPFAFNTGQKRGALVEARAGKGRWIYVGLGLWRQLPAGTDGAYQLLANLISLGKAPAASSR